MVDNLTHATEADFQQEVLKADGLVVVDFWAEWCAPCRMLAPMFEKLATEFAGRMKFVKVDVDASPDAPNKHGVRGIPTLIIFQKGKEVDRVVGVLPEKHLRAQLEAHLQPA